MRRLAVCLTLLGLLLAAPAAEAAGLSIKRARSAAFKLTYKVGVAEDAAYALAGHCKRKSARRVDCWGALIYSDRSAAAQRIKIVKGRKVSAKRYGRIYTGSLSEGGGSSGANDQWAVCTPGGFCVGS